MRIVVLILAVLGAGTSGFLGYRWRDNYRAEKDSMEKNREMLTDPDKARIAGLFLGENLEKAKANLAEFDKRAKTWPYLFVGCALGIVGAVLAYLRKGLFAAVVLLVGAILPAVLHPATLVFTFPLILAGLLALFIRAPQPAGLYGKVAT